MYTGNVKQGTVLYCTVLYLSRMYTGNVKQVLNVSQIFALKMIQDKIRGAIVNISSQVGTFLPPPHYRVISNGGYFRNDLWGRF